jgi:DNA-binding CsgD family transcriptional regulator
MAPPPDLRSRDLQTAAFDVLDVLGIGLVLVDASCHLLQANRSARVILQARDGLSVDGAALLRVSRGTNPTLAELLGRLTVPPMAGVPVNHLIATVRRPFGGAFTMFVCRPAMSTLQGTRDGLVVPLLLLDQAGYNPAPQSALRGIFGLTNAEGRLANLLMEGVALKACGELLGIRRNTVAFHLKNLYRKTGTRGQNKLVSVLFRSIALASGVSSLHESNLGSRDGKFVSVSHEELRKRV